VVQRPILFLDVDGVLIPYGSGAAPDSASVLLAGPKEDDELLSRINPAHGPRLLALGCELVWATGWESEANEVISPRVGLPRLPVLAWSLGPTESGPAALHWKTRDLVAWARGRPFVWVDDEISSVDRDRVALDHRGPALLRRIDSRLGLSDADIAAIDRWLNDLPTVD
jgi:HAD domain in Swiss Army Knife RNA repair proteins